MDSYYIWLFFIVIAGLGIIRLFRPYVCWIDLGPYIKGPDDSKNYNFNFLEGDSTRGSKMSNKNWRKEWPYALLSVKRNGQIYKGFVHVYFHSGGMHSRTFLPVAGPLAVRVGDGDVGFAATTMWGEKHLELVVEKLVDQKDVPPAYTKI